MTTPIERVAPEIGQDLIAAQPSPKKSLWELCTNLGTAPSTTEVDQVRQEEWSNFPGGAI